MADKGVQVLDRAFDILELLSLEKEGLGVTEIGNRIGLHKSTVHRLLLTMSERGYIEKSQNKGIYKIGLRLIEISSVYLNNVELKTEARPYLWELMSKFKQPTHLAILDGKECVYIDKVEVLTSIRLYSKIGYRVPLYCSALGKSLLSGYSDIELDEILSKFKIDKITENTILNKDELSNEIEQVRFKGWSIDNEEHELGIRCVASPIFDYRNKVVAAVSISGPATVICQEKDEEIGKHVRDIALKISNRLGYK